MNIIYRDRNNGGSQNRCRVKEKSMMCYLNKWMMVVHEEERERVIAIDLVYIVYIGEKRITRSEWRGTYVLR